MLAVKLVADYPQPMTLIEVPLYLRQAHRIPVNIKDEDAATLIRTENVHALIIWYGLNLNDKDQKLIKGVKSTLSLKILKKVLALKQIATEEDVNKVIKDTIKLLRETKKAD